MVSFRLVLPDGEGSAVDDDREVELTEDARVVLGIAAGKLRVVNSGAETVTISYQGGEENLSPDDAYETTKTCSFYVKGLQSATMHRIEVTDRGKRRKLEEKGPDKKAFGFQLYRLRERRGMTEADGEMESDLKGWFRGKVEYACLSDYMVDLDWLLSAVPSLSSIPRVLLVHGEKNDTSLRESIRRHKLTRFTLHLPPLPIMMGTHHTKACILKFSTGVRIVIHTANLIYADCGNKTQGAWVQDFPPKTDTSTVSEFERDLVRYLTALHLPTARKTELFSIIGRHDFSSARTKLIASVPGYHKGSGMKLFGHLALRECLSHESFENAFRSAPIVCQFSSLGSLDEKWVYDEFMTSLSAGRNANTMEPLRSPSNDSNGLQLIWPTSEQVRTSNEGWAAGQSIPGYEKMVRKPFLQQHWCKFNAVHLKRNHAMPHIKSYTRYAHSRLAWVLLASHNLSKAAWGTLQKKGTQFMIRSYELGVLFLPSLELRYWNSPHRGFHCTHPTTDSTILPQEIEFRPYAPDNTRAEEEDDSDATRIVNFCLPYHLPPEPYADSDSPWMANVSFPGLDVLGRHWGHGPPMYGHTEPAADVSF